MATEVIPSSEARNHLPRIIRDLTEHRQDVVEVGRQRRREVVILAASRFDEMVERERALTDIAWALFASERVENPTSDPVSMAEARRRLAERLGPTA